MLASDCLGQRKPLRGRDGEGHQGVSEGVRVKGSRQSKGKEGPGTDRACFKKDDKSCTEHMD